MKCSQCGGQMFPCGSVNWTCGDRLVRLWFCQNCPAVQHDHSSLERKVVLSEAEMREILVHMRDYRGWLQENDAYHVELDMVETFIERNRHLVPGVKGL